MNLKEEDFKLKDAQTLRRKGYISVEKQKTPGRFWYKTITLILRLIGIVLLFFIPIGTVIGIILILITLKKDKTKLRYKIISICPVCNGELYLSSDQNHGIVDQECDECKTELKINIDNGTISEKYKGKINLHQKEKMNYEVNKDVDLKDLRTLTDDYHDDEEKRKKLEQLEREEILFQRKKEMAEIKSKTPK